MKNTVVGLALTAVFSLSLTTGAFAGDHNKKDKKAKTSYEQMKNKTKKITNDIKYQIKDSAAELEKMVRDSQVNPYYNSKLTGPSLTIEDNDDSIGVTTATGTGLLDEQKRQDMLKKERMEKEMKDKQMMNPNESTDFQSKNTTIYDSQLGDMSMESKTIGSSILEELSSINILQRYNVNFNNCADELSRINGEITKNDAFFACQRYKVN